MKDASLHYDSSPNIVFYFLHSNTKGNFKGNLAGGTRADLAWEPLGPVYKPPPLEVE